MSRVLLAAVSAIILRADSDPSAHTRLAAQPEFAATVRILEDGSFAGSAVVIAPRWVITAAHIVAGKPAATFAIDAGGRRLTVTRVLVRAGFGDRTSRARWARTGSDQALLELSEDAPVRPATLRRQPVEAGALASLVGFGIGGQRGSVAAGTLHAGQNRIDQMGGMWESSAAPDHLMFMDFDVAGDSSFNRIGSAEPETLEGMATGGDSGSGLWVRNGDVWEVVATFATSAIPIARAVDGTFAGGISVYVGLDLAWIEATIR